MSPLKPFTPNSWSVEVSASAQVQGAKWIFEYELKDPRRLVQDGLRPGQWKNWERSDGLWQSTCFEAFVGRPGEKAYWEFNFSPAKRAWNAYVFEKYREPQSPSRAPNFELEDVVSTESTLKCVVRGPIGAEPFEASLTAVIRTGEGISYFALTHAGEKADFHQRESFVLKLS